MKEETKKGRKAKVGGGSPPDDPPRSRLPIREPISSMDLEAELAEFEAQLAGLEAQQPTAEEKSSAAGPAEEEQRVSFLPSCSSSTR